MEAPADVVNNRQIERLKWRSRRGLLELDLVFARFWANPPPSLADADIQLLDRLLQLPDNDLLDLLMRRRDCKDASLLPMLCRLQKR